MNGGQEMKEGSFTKATESPSIGIRYIWRLQYHRGLRGQCSQQKASRHKAPAD